MCKNRKTIHAKACHRKWTLQICFKVVSFQITLSIWGIPRYSVCLCSISIKQIFLFFHCPTLSVCLCLLLCMFSTWSVNCFLSLSFRQTGMWAAGTSLIFFIVFNDRSVWRSYFVSLSLRYDSVLNDCILTRGSDSGDFKKVGRNSQVN